MPENCDNPIRVVIIDAYTLMRVGLRLILEKQANLEVVGEASNSADGIRVVQEQKPDIILLELSHTGDPGLEIITHLKKICRQGRMILITSNDDLQTCLQAIEGGILGVVSKMSSPAVLVKAIEKIHAGEVWIERSMVAHLLNSRDLARRSRDTDPEEQMISQLSERELGVIRLIGQGMKNQQIADELCISESTVRHHLTSIYGKLGVNDRLELLVFVHRKGLVGSAA